MDNRTVTILIIQPFLASFTSPLRSKYLPRHLEPTIRPKLGKLPSCTSVKTTKILNTVKTDLFCRREDKIFELNDSMHCLN